MWYHGILQPTLWQLIVATLALTHVSIISVTLYLHRHSAHRSVQLHPALKHFFRFWLWLTTGMNTRAWTAVHRRHHACCETPDDPHSPRFKGLLTVLLRGAELYRAEARNPETLQTYGRGCPDDWLERRLYSRFPNAGLGLMLGVDLVLFGVAGLTVWALQMIWIAFWAAGVINGLGHAFGYRTLNARTIRAICCRGESSSAARSCITTIMPTRARPSFPCRPGSLIWAGRGYVC